MLLHIGDARERAKRAATAIERAGGEAHFVEALRASQEELGALHRRLTQRTYYAVTEDAYLQD